MTARPVAGQTGLALLSVTVMDAPSPFGQSTITNLLAHIMLPDTNFHIADQSLSNCVWQALGGPASAITSVDMLSLVSLTASGVGITNLWGLQWATNLAELSLAGNGTARMRS